MLFKLMGRQGAPFYSTLQLSRYFKMLGWSYKVGFLGTILLWEICLNRTGAGVNATPALNRQGGNVRVAAITTENFFFQKRMNTLHRSLRSRVLALPPLSGPMILLAPVADLLKIEEPLRKMRQHFLGSSKEQLGTINRSGHKLVPLRAT